MSIGESIQKGFSTTKKGMPLVGLLFVFGFIFNLVNVMMVPKTPEPNAAPSPALIVFGVIFIFLSIFFQAGSMGFVRDLIKTGKASLGSFTSAGGKYYLRLLMLGIVVSLIIGVFVLLAALAVAFLKDKLAPIGVVLAIFFGALGLYFVVMLFLSPYAAVVDEKRVGESIKLSTKLVKKNILTLLGLSAILIVIGFGIGMLLGAILAGISYVIKQEMVSQVVFAVLSSIVNAYLGVVVTAAFMNFYLSLADRNNN